MNWKEHIEDYLEGTMPPEEWTRMDEAISVDRELRTEVDAYRDLRARLEGKRLRNLVKKHAAHPIPTGRIRARRVVWAAITVAGTFTGIYLLSQYLPYPSSKPPTGNEMQSGPEIGTPPADSLSQPDTILQEPMATIHPMVKPHAALNIPSGPVREAIEALEPPDFVLMGRSEEAVDSLSSRRGIAPQPSEMTYEEELSVISEAIGVLRDGQPSRAIQLLHTLPDDLPTFYREEVDWILTLSFLTESNPKGDALLKSIAEDPSHAYRIAALQLKARR